MSSLILEKGESSLKEVQQERIQTFQLLSSFMCEDKELNREIIFINSLHCGKK